MSQWSVLHVPAIAFLPSCVVNVRWVPCDINCWAVVDGDGIEMPISEIGLQLFQALRDAHQALGFTAPLRVAIEERDQQWELTPIWSGGTLASLTRKEIHLSLQRYIFSHRPHLL